MLSQFECVGKMAHRGTSVSVDLGMYMPALMSSLCHNMLLFIAPKRIQVQSGVLFFFFFCKLLTLGSNRVFCSVSPQQGEHGLDEHKLHTYLSALQSLIPPLFAVVLLNAPFTSRAHPHPEIPAIEGQIKGNKARMSVANTNASA